MKNQKILLITSTALLVVHFAKAQTWMSISAPSDYGLNSVALSADGATLLAGAFPGPIIISTNSGCAWITNTSPIGDWYGVTTSADGSKLAASSSTGIYTSPDSGNTWISNNVPVLPWYSIASSADGNNLVAVANDSGSVFVHGGPIYYSTNAGTTWAQAIAPDEYWYSIASSADGTKLAAVVEAVYDGSSQPPGGQIYISTNSGMTWTPSMAPSKHWRSITSSADGSKLAAVAYDGGYPASDPVYTSTNSGATWTSTGPTNHAWYSIASSADGNRLAAITYGGLTYSSTNAGVTWITNILSANWTSIAASADGNKLATTSVDPNLIYISQSSPTPLMNISPVAGGTMLSWIVPSKNFVLQKNLNFTTANWVTLTYPLTLNLTNLQNQVMLSPSDNAAFFRLATP